MYSRAAVNPIVTYANLMLMMDKYIHVILVSYDYQTTYHIHPDDFGDLQTMSDDGAFYVIVNFTASGSWMVAAEFGYMSGSTFLEGFAQTDLTVGGNIPQLSNWTWNYANSGNFRTYDIPEDGIFDDPITVSSNTDPNGPLVQLLMPVFDMMGNIISTRPMNTNITLGLCTPFIINVYWNNSLVPATLVPLLGAAAHITIASPDQAAYHAHAIAILEDTWADTLVTIQPIMAETPQQMMTNMMTDPEVNVTMNAMMMLGLEMNMSLNCQVDMATVMVQMGMTNMNQYFGPPTFGPTLIGDFDWIQDSRNWRVWPWMKIMLPNGTEKLLVPNFDVNVSPTPFDTTSSKMSMNSSTVLTISFVLMLIVAILSL